MEKSAMERKLLLQNARFYESLVGTR